MTVRERLRETVTSAIDLNHRLEKVVAEPARTVKSGHRRGRIDHSQPPWNAPAAYLVLELHSTARRIEDDLRLCLNMGWRPRGGDDGNTLLALDAVLHLAQAVDDQAIADPARTLGGWCTRAQVALGERDLPQRLPREVGQTEARCPYCARLSLRFWATAGEVRCVNPECVDESYHHPVARMDYSPVTQGWVLAWRDGSVGLPMH
jgi:hypothetical protein